MILIINSAGVLSYNTNFRKLLPYATGIIVARLRKEGFDVIHRDLRNLMPVYMRRQLSRHAFDQWLRFNKKTRLMNKYLRFALSMLPNLTTIRLIGMSIISFVNYPYALALAKEIKRQYPRIPICFGGAFITIMELKIPDYIDFFIKGNGGDSISHLANYLIRRAPLDEKLPGLCYRKNGKYIDNGRNQEAADLEDMPDFSDLNLNLYLVTLSINNDKVLIVPYRISLGCTNRCSFCAGRLTDRSRFKSTKKVVSEINVLRLLYRKTVIRFCDTAINNSPKILSEILDALSNENINFDWLAFVKVNSLNESLLKKMAQTGCKFLAWGIENTSPHMLNVYNKKYNPKDAERYLKMASALGISNEIFMMYNGPGETSEDITAIERFLSKFITKRNIEFFGFSEFSLRKNTDIFNNSQKYGIEILDRSYKDIFLENERIQWKEAALSLKEFTKKQKVHRERIHNLVCKFTVTRYCLRKKIANRLLINVLSVIYSYYKLLKLETYSKHLRT